MPQFTADGEWAGSSPVSLTAESAETQVGPFDRVDLFAFATERGSTAALDRAIRGALADSVERVLNTAESHRHGVGHVPPVGISRQILYDIEGEKLPVMPALALRLGRLFGNAPEFWVDLQRDYDLRTLEAEMAEELAAIEPGAA